MRSGTITSIFNETGRKMLGLLESDVANGTVTLA
jgi:hypothetical protein